MNHARFFFVTVAVLILSSSNSIKSQPTSSTDSNATNTDIIDIQEMKSLCLKDDLIACLKYRAFKYLNNVIDKDKLQIFDDIQVIKHADRAGKTLKDNSAETYFDRHDIRLKLPLTDNSITISGRDFKSKAEVEGRKSKLKKILVPILVFVMLKAMTLVPLALGVLGLKAWNALQLAFFSFVTSMALAIFQLCKKIAADNSTGFAAHTAWEAPYKRSLNEPMTEKDLRSTEKQQMAYRAY